MAIYCAKNSQLHQVSTRIPIWCWPTRVAIQTSFDFLTLMSSSDTSPWQEKKYIPSKLVYKFLYFLLSSSFLTNYAMATRGSQCGLDYYKNEGTRNKEENKLLLVADLFEHGEKNLSVAKLEWTCAHMDTCPWQIGKCIHSPVPPIVDENLRLNHIAWFIGFAVGWSLALVSQPTRIGHMWRIIIRDSTLPTIHLLNYNKHMVHQNYS